MWIEPLDLETIIIQVFSGNPDIFGAISILVITSFASYFRMNGLIMFFMLGIFVLMFSGFIGINFLIVFALIGGLVVGYSVRKIFQ